MDRLDNTRPWLVAVCAGRWQMHGIRQSQQAGARVLALDGDPNADGFAVADQSFCVDIGDPNAAIQAIRSSGLKPAGVISFAAEAGLKCAAAIREAFDLPGPDKNLTHRLTDKESQRLAWDTAGLPNPEWRVVRSKEEAENAVQAVGLPVIVKPADSAGSRGVSKLETLSGLEAVFDHALEHSPSGRVMVESFIEGLECTVETFSHHHACTVLLVTEKIKVPGTNGTVAQELRTPEFSSNILERLRQTAAMALAALDYTDGPGHTEIIVRDDGEVFLVEAAGRGAGFMVFDAMVPTASGFDLAGACAVQALGREPELPSPAQTPVVLRFFPSKPGRVTRLSGFDEAAAIPGVAAGAIVDIDHVSRQAATDGDRLGYILAHGDTREQALERARLAEQTIRIEIEPWP